MEVKSLAKHVRVTPRKARLVVDLIRGERVEKALNILQFTNKRGAFLVQKTLKSAVANAESKAEAIESENLFVKEVFVNEGPVLKRFRPRAMGRASRIRKRTSHITIVLGVKKAKQVKEVTEKKVANSATKNEKTTKVKVEKSS